MNKLLRMGALLATAAALSFSAPVYAQDSEPAPPAVDAAESKPPEKAGNSSSQEVEVNEDTYRQFMELKDANRQGDIIPETVFRPGTGLQKLEKLPEDSQKHLRNELREIIVDGDPWQPGDETADYPYTPSALAGKDPALRKQELEAWGELVDSYNQREAQIYASKSGNRAALSTVDGSSGQRGESADSSGEDGEDREGAPGQPPGRDESPDDRDAAGAFSADAIRNQHAESASGVSQNALEFLQGLGGGAEDAAGQEPVAPQVTGVQPDAPTAAGATQNAAEFLNQTGARAGHAAAGGSGASSPERSQVDSGKTGSYPAMAGGQQAQQDTPQSLAQDKARDSAPREERAAGAQAGEQTETAARTSSAPVFEGELTFSSSEPEDESTAGSSQNALEYLRGSNAQADAAAKADANTSPPPSGTLNIQDLLNAQGVGGPAGTTTPDPAPEEEKPAGDASTDKDGGGR